MENYVGMVDCVIDENQCDDELMVHDNQGIGDLEDNVTIDGDGEKTIEQPKVGMKFKSEQEVRLYYEQYTKKVGFGIVRRTSKTEDDGLLKYLTLACSRNGTAKSQASNPLKPRGSEQIGCNAKVNVALCIDGCFAFSSITLEHNHALSPGKTRFFRCNKKLDSHVKKKLELNDQAGICPSKNYKSLVIEAGGYENLPFGEKDCQNYIAKVQQLRLREGGAETLRNYFVQMQEKDENFFYVMDLDDEYRLRNVFWADGRSRAAYKVFGDVTFDTTYLTNQYRMPFAPFVGVNHHGHSILFGCGLISNEDIETFVWLFEAWLRCMSGRAPPAIITDQDKAMKIAIATVFPQTRHRFCLWHILKKLPEKFGSHLQYNSIKNTLLSCVYDSISVHEFEDSWQQLLDNYHLQDNTWLSLLYGEREHWIPAYVKDTFWAEMSTTQRSESMNAFFDDYVNSKTSLAQFVEQYDSALRSKVEKESLADFNSFNSVIPCISDYNIEKQFQEAYTNAKFKEVQEEFKSLMYCNAMLLTCNGSIVMYQVVDQRRVSDAFMKAMKFCVYFNHKEYEVKCTCRLFEFRGILCRHALAVMTIAEGIQSVPSKYILDRWRKDIKRPYTFVRCSYDNFEHNPESQRYVKMCNDFSNVASIASTSDELCAPVMAEISRLKITTQSWGTKYQAKQAYYDPPGSFSIGSEAMIGVFKESDKVHSPLMIKSKGRPPSKRKVSTVEKAVNRLKARKTQPGDKQSGKRNVNINNMVL